MPPKRPMQRVNVLLPFLVQAQAQQWQPSLIFYFFLYPSSPFVAPPVSTSRNIMVIFRQTQLLAFIYAIYLQKDSVFLRHALTG